MRKFYLFLFALLAVCGLAKAQVTVTPTAASGEKDGISFTTTKNNGQTAPTYNATGQDLRIYAKGSITISSTVGNMKSIVFNISAQGLKRLAPITADKGTIAAQAYGDKTVTWTGDATTVTLTVGDKADYGSEGSSKAGQLCFTDFVVTVGAVDPTYVEKPVISPATGTYFAAQEVTITAGEGAAIYYTTDGSEPTARSNAYTAPFTVRQTTTVKAIAVSGKNSSEVAESVITIDTESDWASTAENPMTVAKALELIQTLDAGKTGEIEVYVKGIVTSVSEINLTHGNATYTIADGAGDVALLTVYRGFSFNGDKFLTNDALQVNDEVVVVGKLQNYVKNEVSTPEVASGSRVYSINGKTSIDVVLPEYNTLAALKAAVTTDVVNVQLNLTECLVTFVNGQNLYLYDGQDGLLVFGANSGIKAGDKISGTIKGQLSLYQGLTELSNPTYSAQVVSSGNVVEPQVISIGDLQNAKAYESELVTIEELTPQAAAFEAKNLVFIDEDESELVVRDKFSVMTDAAFNTASSYNVTGFVAIYATDAESTVQVYPRTAEDIVNPAEEELETPEAAWNPASVQVKVGETVTAAFRTNSDGAVSYESSNPDVATVDNQGNITIVGAGSAKITATVEATNTYKSAAAVLEIAVLSGDADGSLAHPYSVGDAKAYYNAEQASEKVWVKGYIIGSADGSMNKLVKEGGDAAVASNLVLVDSNDGSGTADMLPVALANNTAARTALNLKDNADLLGKQVWVYGTIEKYFGVAGVKNVTNWSFDGRTEENATEVLPTISPATGTYETAQEVTITVAEGSVIYYTLDGTDPTAETGTLYTAPFTVEETTTVKAIAVTGDKVSKVVTSVITIGQGQEEVGYTKIADLKADATATKTTVTYNANDVLVTYVNGSSVYVTDGRDAMLLYGTNSGIAAGDRISAKVQGELYLYNGLTEIAVKSISDLTVISSGNEVTAQEVQIADLMDNVKAYENELVVIKDVTPAAEAWASRNITFVDESENSIAVRDNWKIATDLTFDPQETYDITGFVAIYVNGEATTIQIYPRSKDDIVKTSEAELQIPVATWSVERVQVKVGEAVDAVFRTNSDGAVSYESSNPEVATVDNQGNITIVGAGSAKITATVEATKTYKSAAAVLEIAVSSGDADGSLAHPYSVGDVQALATATDAPKGWVRGYIVGFAKNSMAGSVFSATAADGSAAPNTNILLAASATENDYHNCVPVELRNSLGIREALSLKDHPDYLGKEVWIQGTLTPYFSVPGVKTVTNWSFDGRTEEYATEVLPTITPATGTYETAQQVSISVAEGSVIYYTLDGTEPTAQTGTLYSAPFTVEETTTVKAIAVTGDKVSKVVTSVITISQGQEEEGYTKIADLKADATATKTAVTYNAQDVLVTYVNGSSVYVTDGTDAMLLYGTNSGIAAGNRISAKVQGDLYLYNGLTEIAIKSISDLTVLSEGNEVTAQEVQIADLLANVKAYENELVVIKDVTPAAEAWASRNITFVDESENQIAVRDNWNIATGLTFDPQEAYDITGFVAIYTKGESTTIQIYPRSKDDILKVSESELQIPEAAWSVESVQVKVGDAVEAVFSTNSDGAVSYESSNPEVATVNENGVITIVGVGPATITATVAKTNTFKDASAELVVAVTTDADGSIGNPYTIGDVQALCALNQSSEKVWVMGYIIGSADGAFNENKLVKEGGEKASVSNFVLADAADEAAIANMIPVELPKGKVREALNLKDNADLLGKQIWLYGTIEKYFSVAGVKSVSDFSFDGLTAIKSVDAENAAAKVIYNVAGQRVQNLNKAGIYIVNGKKVAVK